MTKINENTNTTNTPPFKSEADIVVDILNPQEVKEFVDGYKAICDQVRNGEVIPNLNIRDLEKLAEGSREVKSLIDKFKVGKINQSDFDVQKQVIFESLGNIAIARANINTLEQEVFKAYSNYRNVDNFSFSNYGEKGKYEAKWIGEGNTKRYAEYDTEMQILSDIDKQLGGNSKAVGEVIVYTERVPCESCLWVKSQFEADYPNIQLTFVDGQNNIII